MEIIKSIEITQKWHQGFNRNFDDIQEIVIHGTGGGSSSDALISWMLSGERQESYKKGIGLFHFFINFTGDIFQFADLNKWYYHSTCGKHDKHTIGIELLNSSANNSNVYTKYQYKYLFELIFDNLLLNFKNIKSIVGHDYNGNRYSGIKKGCPGSGFDWTILEKELKVRNIKYQNFGFEAYHL